MEQEQKKNILLRDGIEKPDCVEEAKVHKGLNLALETLIFGVLMIVTMSIEAVAIGVIARFVIKTGDQNTMIAGFTSVISISLFMLYAKFVQKRPLCSLGFRKDFVNPFKEYAWGILVGFGAVSAMVLFMVLTGNGEFTGRAMVAKIPMILLCLVGCVLGGMEEEVLFRGFFMISVARRYPMWLAILLNAIIFAAYHLFCPEISLLSFINLFLFGLFAGICFVKRGSIWCVGAFHCLWNFTEGNIYGQIVSGYSNMISLFQVKASGNAWITGGDFGPEGSLTCTVVFLIIIIFTLKMSSKRKCL